MITTSRIASAAPIVTLVLSFLVVFGLGRLFGGASEPGPINGPNDGIVTVGPVHADMAFPASPYDPRVTRLPNDRLWVCITAKTAQHLCTSAADGETVDFKVESS